MGYVVVGMDDSEASRRALIHAVDLAERLDLDVRVVHTYVPDPSGTIQPGALRGATLRTQPARPGEEHDPVLRAQATLRRLVEDTLGGPLPDRLETLVIDEGRPGDVLLEQARFAEYAVVGTRGQGHLANLVFGSTATKLLQKATCPVVVVRQPTTVR